MMNWRKEGEGRGETLTRLHAVVYNTVRLMMTEEPEKSTRSRQRCLEDDR
jgi:hypothetical protein